MAPRLSSSVWEIYTPAIEAWQAFLLNSMAGAGRASLMWMMVPLDVGLKALAQPRQETNGEQHRSWVDHAADAAKQAEAFADRAYASTLDAGYRSFREFEAATLDRGTYDGGAWQPSHSGERRAA